LEIVGVIRPAALSYLEIESTIGQNVTAENKFPVIDRNNIDLDFRLNQKSYALAINAVSMLAVNRPAFFQDSATCLARRVMDPPSSENSSLGKAACMAVRSHLRASCLTLLRNALSVTSKSADILTEALSSDECGMKIQADKALGMAKQAANLKTAGRAARNRAAIFYEWDSAKDEGDEMVELSKKRQRAGDDALEKMRAAKAARGLGSGIQLPKNMADACELILLNLSNLPSTRAAAIKGDKKSQTKSDMKRKRPFTFDYLVDVIISNGASLVSDENRWYGRDGGDAWSMEIAALVSDDEAPSASIESPPLSKAPVPITFTLDMKMTEAAVAAVKGDTSDIANLYMDQCKAATADAFERILQRARSVKDQSVADFGNQIAARLAWSLKGVQPLHELKDDENIVNNGLSAMATKYDENTERKSKYESLQSFASEYPLVASCIQFDLESNSLQMIGNDGVETSSTASSNLAQKILNEAYMGISSGPQSDEMYRKALDLYICTILHACENADDKPMDIQRKKIASSASATLSKHLGELPSLPEDALESASLLCDVGEITKKAKESSRKTSSQNIQTSAAINAAKAAAEKRAKMILIALRDVAFQRSRLEVRSDAVNCAIGIATGRLPSSPAVEEMALKLVMNVLYPKSPELANQVVAAASRELERVSRYAIENFDKIREANEEALAKKGEQVRISPLQPISDTEKAALEKVKKSANLFMALCIRRPDIIKTLMSSSCQEGADILAKAVRNNMSKMALAAGKKYGSNKIAQQVAEMADVSETPLLLSFLDSLCPTSGAPPTPELIEAYISIQNSRLVDGQKDPRYIIPVLSGMKRSDLESQIASFVDAEDNVFKAALNRMSERLHKQMYSFREEPEQQPTLLGMTLCEQIVCLHRMDFAASNIPQKRYLDAIRICLEDDEVYTDRVIMAALDYISVTFLNGEPLPLAYMRTLILTCSKHESLHSWICNELLPRLVEGKVYNDKRQWEGWMRCAKMLESGDVGASSANAIQQLPEEIRDIYRSRYPK
jgi:symplekin